MWLQMSSSACTMGCNHDASVSLSTKCAQNVALLVVWMVLHLFTRGVVSSDCYIVTIYGLKHAQCEGKGYQVIPQDLDKDIKVLELQDNTITHLEIDNFKNYKSLQQIYLARNEISTIAPEAFRHLDNLQILDLSNNKLDDVPSTSFKHLRSLRKLKMKSNQIRHITADAFTSLTKLEKIDVENNWLSRIDPHALNGLQQLQEINLVNNDLKTLSAEMEKYLPASLRSFRLYWNPWNCDCKLRWLLEWLMSNGVNWDFKMGATNTPICSEPQMIRDVAWKELGPESFACPSDIIINNTTSFDLIEGTNITIECEVYGDPPPKVTWAKGSQKIDDTTDMAKYRLHIQQNTHKLWSRLTVLNVQAHDAGEYKCTARNSAGQSSVTYVLREKPLPPPPPKETTVSKGINLNVIIGIAVGGGCVLVLIVACAIYFICRNYQHRHVYRIRTYMKPAKNKQPQKDKPVLDDEEQAIIRENDKGVASAASQLLDEKKKEQEKQLVKEFFKETDIASATVVCNDVQRRDNKEENKEFKMKIFTSYEDETCNRNSLELPSPSLVEPDAEPGTAESSQHSSARTHCNNIKEVTPDLLKTPRQQVLPGSQQLASEPNHIGSHHQKRAEENPYTKPSDLRPGVVLPKNQSRSAEDLLESSGQCDMDKPLCGTMGASRSPRLLHHGNHDASPCSNPICLKDSELGSAKSARGMPKPHIKNSQSMGGIHTSRAQDDSGIDVLPSGKSHRATGGDRYATLPSKPRQGILHNGNSSRTTHYGVRFPDDIPGSPHTSPSKLSTYHYHTVRPASKGQPGHHVSPTKTPIPKYHPQIIRGTTAGGSSRRVTSPAGSDHSGEFSPSRPGKTFASTSLDDILNPSPPFGYVEKSTMNGKKATRKVPKPGEKDEYGTAV